MKSPFKDPEDHVLLAVFMLVGCIVILCFGLGQLVSVLGKWIILPALF